MVSRIVGCFFGAALIFFPLHATGQSESAGPAFTLRANTNLVVEDIVVTDEHGNPIHNLTGSDFTILENGQSQAVKSFAEHTAVTPAPLPPLPKLPPGTFTNESVTPTDGTLNILLFDKLNTPMDAQSTVTGEVLKYLKNPSTGGRTAIFTLTTQLKLLQGFTSDPAVLRALVEGKKVLPGESSLMASSTSVAGSDAGDAASSIYAAQMGNRPIPR